MRARHELKYMISEPQALAIVEYMRPYMRPDRHSANGWYPLVSLYFDSPDLRMYRESIEGVKNRYKLRIRSYSDNPAIPCFFEVKRRVNQVIIKSRARVLREHLPSLISGQAGHTTVASDEHQNLEQFLFYQRQLRAVPMVRVRYLRQAFQSRGLDDVRITFDRQLSFRITRTPDVGLNGPGWLRIPNVAVVLEIKFNVGYPRWIGDMVRQFGLRMQSMSKYARSITEAYARGFNLLGFRGRPSFGQTTPCLNGINQKYEVEA